MSDLEQQLADELDAVAAHLRQPDLTVPGLVAAGRREQKRGRALLAAATGAAVAAVLAVAVALPGGGASDEPAPIAPTTGTDDALGRPLELPWWSADDRLLSVAGTEIEVAATRLVRARGVTLVQAGRQWFLVDDDVLVLLTSATLAGDPVIGTDGSIAWLEDHPEDARLGDPESDPVPVEYVLNLQAADGARSAVVLDAEITCCDAGGVLELVAVLPDGRLLLTRSGRPEVFDPDGAAPVPVTGVPDDLTVGSAPPWPGGLTAQRGAVLVTAQVDRDDRWRTGWEASGDGTGAWSDDGEQYAEADGGEVRFATRAGTTTVSMMADGLRVVGWESDSEVVVARWIEDEGVFTRLWRCSAVELRCAAIEESLSGRFLLPGL